MGAPSRIPNSAATAAPTEEHRPEHEPCVAAEVGDDVDAQDAVAEQRRDVGVGVRADREERRVAEVEQARDTDDEVQAEREHDEHARIGEPVHPGVGRLGEA